MPNIKNVKNPNVRGSVNIAIGELMKDVKQVAEQENRSVNRQIAVIIREWLAARKASSGKPSVARAG